MHSLNKAILRADQDFVQVLAVALYHIGICQEAAHIEDLVQDHHTNWANEIAEDSDQIREASPRGCQRRLKTL